MAYFQKTKWGDYMLSRIYIIIIPRKLKQEDCHFHTRLGCLVRPDCFFERNRQYPQNGLKTKQLLTPQKLIVCCVFLKLP